MMYRFNPGDKVVSLNRPDAQAGVIIADYDSRAFLMVDCEKYGLRLINIRKANKTGAIIVPYNPDEHTQSYLKAGYQAICDMIETIKGIQF